MPNRPEQNGEQDYPVEDFAAMDDLASAQSVGNLSPELVRDLLHKVHRHQLELERQNEALRRAQADVDAARARYFELYDQAPVGYCTLSAPGLIVEANLTAASMLGVERGALIRQPFSRFVVKEFADIFHRHRRRILKTSEPLSCELRMAKHRGAPFWVHVAATVVHHGDAEATLRIVLSDVTECKQAELALHKSEAFNRAVLDSLNAEIAVLDHEGTIVAVNRAWRRFALENIGVSGPSEPSVRIGANYLAVCEADGSAGALISRSGIQAVLDGQLPGFSQDYPCHSADQQRWFSMNVTPLGDGAVISHTNITPLKQLEHQAKASSLYSRSLIEASLDPLLTISAEGKITDVNRAAERVTGVSRDELLNTDCAAYFTDPEEARAAYRQAFALGSVIDYPLAIRHVSGRTTDVLYNASVYCDAVGQVLGVFAAARDITERKRAEEELRGQKEFFHLIAENIGDFIAVLDLEGRRLYNSPSYRHFFASGKDLRGTDSFAEVHPDDRERVRKVFVDTVNTGRGRQLEYRLMMGDGSVREMESRGSVIRDGEGRVARVVVVSHDITERKRMENQVRQMAFHDPLTRLPNRRLLNDRLNQTMAASTRSGLYGAVMFLDLDNFKPLNDSHGHDVGDLLLIEVAERLKSCVREMDTVARFGGDEFVVMISELDTSKSESLLQARIIAEKIRLRLAEPYRLNVRLEGRAESIVEHHCSASIGVVLFINHEASQENLLRWADAAMYQAKESERNSIRFIDPARLP